MRRNVGVVFGLLFFLATYAQVNAQTIDELKAMILLLTQQITAIEQQIAARGGTPNPSVGVGASCPILTRALYTGLSGQDVTSLQRFLSADISIYPEGLMTGYFGPATERAVQRWQARNSVISTGSPSSTGYGVVGPGTRAAIARVCAGGGTVTTPPPPVSSGNCTIAGGVMQNGETKNFYTTSTVAVGAQCFASPRTCNNGILSGDPAYVHATCATTMRGCFMDGAQINHGETRTLYLTRDVAFGASCQSTPRTCTDGTLGGNTAYGFATCASPVTGRACSIDGVSVKHGETRTTYLTRDVAFGASCQSTQRTCTDGILGGNTAYGFATCVAPVTGRTCPIDGVTINHGQNATLYTKKTVLFGQACAPFAQTRTCTDGTLGGDATYQFASCAPEGARPCEVVNSGATTSVAHLAGRDFYSAENLVYPAVCSDYKQTRICTDGHLSGSATYRFPGCTATPPRTCTLDFVTMAHGGSRVFYSSRSVATGVSCSTVDATRTCADGTLSGSATFKYAVCAPVGQRWCAVGGKFTAHNATAPYYSTVTVPFGNLCSQYEESRTCTDGTLGGNTTYVYGSCTVSPAATCTLGGKTVAHGASAPFYSVTAAPANQICAAYQQIRTCNDGFLSGSASFSNGTCVD